MKDGRGPRVVALVLSHNAPHSLARCLNAIAAQTTLPEEIVVVDNASDPPIEVRSLPFRRGCHRGSSDQTSISDQRADGHRSSRFPMPERTHAWVMDDDIVPETKCLATCGWQRPISPTAFVVPVSIQPDGGRTVGFLVRIPDRPRDRRDRGPTQGELFWWAEDTEYCHWRIPQAGFRRRFIEGAVVHHDAIRQGGDVPTWKYYYEARNMLYLHWHIMHRTGRYPKNFSRLVGRALFRQRQDRIACLVAVGRGLIDGATGRLGIRYPTVAMHERDLQ